jgi:hypothetical protein
MATFATRARPIGHEASDCARLALDGALQLPRREPPAGNQRAAEIGILPRVSRAGEGLVLALGVRS